MLAASLLLVGCHPECDSDLKVRSGVYETLDSCSEDSETKSTVDRKAGTVTVEYMKRLDDGSQVVVREVWRIIRDW